MSNSQLSHDAIRVELNKSTPTRGRLNGRAVVFPIPNENTKNVKSL